MRARPVGEQGSGGKLVHPVSHGQHPLSRCHQFDAEKGKLMALDEIVRTHLLHPATDNFEGCFRCGFQIQKEMFGIGDLPRDERRQMVVMLCLVVRHVFRSIIAIPAKKQPFHYPTISCIFANITVNHVS